VCGEYITEERFYYIEEQKVCEECLDNLYRRDTDDYVQEDE
jgi:formylmethanofuran dehydrogenase subunit E